MEIGLNDAVFEILSKIWPQNDFLRLHIIIKLRNLEIGDFFLIIEKKNYSLP